MSLQAPSGVVMVRPSAFRPNPQTRGDNAFQTEPSLSASETAANARHEFDTAVSTLRGVGITVHVFEDTGDDTPDSVFPNNWFSTHAGGHVAVYPMFAENRRRERRWDVIDLLKRDYRVQDVIDYSGLEPDGLALEGTGAMVLDHLTRIAYVARSNRADPVLLERFCTHFNYEPIVFDAVDAGGLPIYHTNVLMTVATGYALVGFDLIPDAVRRDMVRTRLAEPGRDVIALYASQIANFAGNAIELSGGAQRYLVLSRRAQASLTSAQTDIISRSATLLPLDLPTIENAGGSARCMIAGVHLARR